MKTPYLPFMLLISFLSLAGCATGGVSTERYTLPSGSDTKVSAKGETRSNVSQRTLIMGNLELASYLESQGIILQSDDIRVREASSHLWAESLKRQLDRGLRQRLAARLPNTRVLESGNSADALHLQVNVDQFQGRYDGLAVVSGHWQLYDDTGKLLVLEPFNETQALKSDGYPALVRALGRAWDQVAGDIAKGIKSKR
ncbi:membrane integrity-associated transporter subunit PqiC [Halomonas sp. M20]|uniref:PqiC family protein n=1 Tax=Halomonas sp. M20 TaxID=2763264 RepID=UPI001D0A4B22|nr:ABC-type transport auxiliary lipoprotein family protein [Halomonas sp. M20]